MEMFSFFALFSFPALRWRTGTILHQEPIIVFVSGTFSYDQGLPSLDEATSSVDALVAEDDFIPPSLANSNQVSRSSTPTVPPGFSLSHAHPPPSIREETVVKVPSRFVPTSAPFTPSRVSAVPRVATPLSIPSIPSTPQSASKPKATAPVSQAKQDVKTLASNTGLSKAIATQASQGTLQTEDFPALDSGKIKAPTTPSKPAAQAKTAPAAKVSKKQPATPAGSTSATTETSVKLPEKRTAQTLNITVSTKPSVKVAATEKPTPVKSESSTSAFPPLPVSTPGAAVQSPLTRPAPKTLRLTATPKTENPPAGSTTPVSTTSMFPPNRLPSRQPSLASASRLDRPGTPSSDLPSDNASITSASMSRPGSPPPSKVGSAPVRMTTKSMQKKQRRELQKEKEKSELEAMANTVEPEPEIAPIIGRKKKQKKEPKERTMHSAAGGSTPIPSRPVSPSPVESRAEEEAVHSTANEQVSQKPSPTETETSKFSRQDYKGKGKAKMQPVASPESPPPAPEVEDEVVERSIPTPAMVLQDLQADGVIGDSNSLSLLKNPATTHRFDAPIDPQTVNQKLTISPEDRASLMAGTAVQKVAEGPNRIMLTPNGDCIRNLTPEEEQKYLDLQARIASEYGPSSFTSAKHHASNGFALIGGRAVPNGPPSFFPATNNGTPAMDPVSKIQRDEALSYINQYVLPSLSTNSQLEKALNANALESEIGRSGENAAWSTWGSDANAPRPEAGHEGAYNTSNRDGMIATGIEHMTAHFAIGSGGELNRGQPLGNVSLLSLSESEGAMQVARKETEGLEKRLNALIKKNRRLLMSPGH
ncbi:hypothetical protein VTL71DRAFT_14243 [Oculimacula yallundae]|uniref:Uncharacterized protein n=1 Tax=Oculimacula yallundae TaxID=86028 RepID=A0ABR4CHX6_9HELO